MLKVLKMHPEEDKRVLYHLIIERGKKYRYQKSVKASSVDPPTYVLAAAYVLGKLSHDW